MADSATDCLSATPWLFLSSGKSIEHAETNGSGMAEERRTAKEAGRWTDIEHFGDDGSVHNSLPYDHSPATSPICSPSGNSYASSSDQSSVSVAISTISSTPSYNQTYSLFTVPEDEVKQSADDHSDRIIEWRPLWNEPDTALMYAKLGEEKEAGDRQPRLDRAEQQRSGPPEQRPPCSCGVEGAPCIYRWSVQPGEVRFECSVCHKMLGGNSSNSHLHMLKEHGVSDPCVVWLDTWRSTHRRHRSAVEETKEATVRRVNPKSNGKSTCSPACWERLIKAVLDFYELRPRRPNEAIFDQTTRAEQYCDCEMHAKSGTVPPTAKTVQGKWAAIREHLAAGRTTNEVAGNKAAPLYCWLVETWADTHPKEMAQLRVYAGGAVAKPSRKPPPTPTSVPSPVQPAEETLRSFRSVARGCVTLLSQLSLSYRVAHSVEWHHFWRSTHHSCVVDPATLLRVRDYPFVSLAVLCHSPLFDPLTLASMQWSMGAADPAFQLFSLCGITRLGWDGPVDTGAIDLMHRLLSVSPDSPGWLSLFRQLRLDVLPMKLTPLLTDQELAAMEKHVSLMVLPYEATQHLLEDALATLTGQLNHHRPDTAVNHTAHSVQPVLLETEHALERMLTASGTYLRCCMWQRCRVDMMWLSQRAVGQLQPSQSSSDTIATRLRLFLHPTTLAVQASAPADGIGGAISVTWPLLHDDQACVDALSLLVSQLEGCTLDMPTLSPLFYLTSARERLWHTLLVLTSLYVAIVHPLSSALLIRPARKHEHGLFDDFHEQCLLCLEQRLAGRGLQLPTTWMTAAWKEAAQVAGVSVLVFRVFEEINQLAMYTDPHSLGSQANALPIPLATKQSDSSANGARGIDSHPDTPVNGVKAAETCSDIRASRPTPAAPQDTSTTAAVLPLTPSLAPCAVCNSAEADALLLPCQHASCCQQCAGKLKEQYKSCPRPGCTSGIQWIIAIERKHRTQEVCYHVPPATASEPPPGKLSAPLAVVESTLSKPPPQTGSVSQQSSSQPPQSMTTAATQSPAVHFLASTTAPPPALANEVKVAVVGSAATLSVVPHSSVPVTPLGAAVVFDQPIDPLLNLALVASDSKIDPLLASPEVPIPAASIGTATIVVPPVDSIALVTPALQAQSLPPALQIPHLRRRRVQTGVVRFTCSACNRMFEGNSSNAHLHMTTHHNVRNVSVVYEDGQIKQRKTRANQRVMLTGPMEPVEPMEPSTGSEHEAAESDKPKAAEESRPARSTAMPSDVLVADSTLAAVRPIGPKSGDFIEQRMVVQPALPITTISSALVSSTTVKAAKPFDFTAPSKPPPSLPQSYTDEVARVQHQVSRAKREAEVADNERQSKWQRVDTAAESHHAALHSNGHNDIAVNG